MDWLTLALTTLVSAGLGSYLSGYFKKKGENLATQQDIEKVRHEVEVVTTTTKNIEARISHEVWERQRTWELKREVLVEITKRIAALDDALVKMHVAFSMAGDGFTEARLNASKGFTGASAQFDETRLLVDVLCGTELKTACDTLRLCTNDLAARIPKDPAVYKTSTMDLAKSIFDVKHAIRHELGISKKI